MPLESRSVSAGIVLVGLALAMGPGAGAQVATDVGGDSFHDAAVGSFSPSGAVALYHWYSPSREDKPYIVPGGRLVQPIRKGIVVLE